MLTDKVAAAKLSKGSRKLLAVRCVLLRLPCPVQLIRSSKWPRKSREALRKEVRVHKERREWNDGDKAKVIGALVILIDCMLFGG